MFFPHPQKMLIIVAQKRNDRSQFVFHQEKRNYYLGNYDLSTRNIAALKCESRKTKCWVPWTPLYSKVLRRNNNIQQSCVEMVASINRCSITIAQLQIRHSVHMHYSGNSLTQSVWELAF